MAYGTGGMMPLFGAMYVRFAEALAKAGYFALILDYLARTNTPHNLEMFNLLPTCRTDWISTLCDAVTNTITLNHVDASRVALCGFSLGGNLMIHVAQTNRPNAFIDFFAPIVSRIDPASVVTETMASNLPSTLILHGDHDNVAPYSDSQLMEKWLKNANLTCKLVTYPNQGHPSLENPSSWSVKSQNDSLAETIRFLQAQL